MRLLPLLSLLLTTLTLPVLADAPSPMPLRIGLDHDYRHATLLLLSCDKTFTLSDALTARVIAHGDGNTVYKIAAGQRGFSLIRAGEAKDVPVSDGTQALTVQPGAGDFVKIARLDGRVVTTKGPVWHRYRGFLTVRHEPDNTLRVINTVPLEPYLYGVLPAEIGTKVPMEALKAQAVAARTYALRNRGKCSKDGFDLDDTTHCEGYEGVNGEAAQSNAAVDSTRGQVLTYVGRLIDAPFSTDSGGMTACDTNGGCPYLQAVRDADPSDGKDYAAGGKYHVWTQTFTSSQIAQLLARDPRTRVAQFGSLTLDSLDASGRIVRATVAGADGTLKTVSGPLLRQILGYDVLRSTRVTLTRMPDGDYRFDGRGWGHGLGMSQDGAVAMAGPPYGKNYVQILKHYYVGVQIAPADRVRGLEASRRGL